MPRQPRLDAPGLLQHIMARGIEGREIFKDDQDRKSFPARLGCASRCRAGGGRGKGDERILGSGDFVSEVLREAGEIFESLIEKRMSLEELIDAVAQYMGVSIEEIKSSSRKRKLAYARSVVAYAAIRNLGYRGTQVAEVLSLSPPTVSQNVEKGKIFLLCREI